jgi:hypothetical protein
VSREPIYSFAAVHNRLTVRGDLLALTALRIGAGRATEIIAADLPVLRDALGAPFYSRRFAQGRVTRPG